MINDMCEFRLDENYCNVKDGCIESVTNKLSIKLSDLALSNALNDVFDNTSVTSAEKRVKLIIPNKIGNEYIKKIGNVAFQELLSVTDIEIEDGIEEIHNSAFQRCYDLQSIKLPNTLNIIGNYIFAQDNNLQNVIILNHLKSIGNGTFYKCKNLQNIKLPNGLETIDKQTFAGCCSLENIVLPNSLLKIGQEAFGGCTSLTHLTIPDSVTEIGSSAFMNCYHLEEVKISDSISVINDTIFGNCLRLEKVILPKKLLAIRHHAFCNCQKLEDINLPDTIEYIGDNAFYCCKELENIKLPKSLSDIGEMAFEDVLWLKAQKKKKEFIVNNNLLIAGLPKFKNITIPNNITAIGPDALKGKNQNQIESIIIPKNVKYISKKFFDRFKNTTIYYNGSENDFNNIKKTTETREKYLDDNDTYDFYEFSRSESDLKTYDATLYNIIFTKELDEIIDNIENIDINKINLKNDYEEKYLINKLDEKIKSTSDLNIKLNALSIRDSVNKQYEEIKSLNQEDER